ncbi:hypothetical protein [Mycobacterium sp.]|uniref:hypothetical protein n=1 Tax=Mycobacterium sp. TaxID=1785 RepID=UPI003C714B29
MKERVALRLLLLALIDVASLVATVTGVSKHVALLLVFGAILVLLALFPLYVLYWKLRVRRLRHLHGSTPKTPNQDTGEIRPRHPTL